MSYISSSWSCCTCLGINKKIHDLHEGLMGLVLERKYFCLKLVLEESTIFTELREILSATSFVGAVVDDEFGEVGLAGV